MLVILSAFLGLVTAAQGAVVNQQGATAASFSASTMTATNCLRVPANGTDFIAGDCAESRVGIGKADPAVLLHLSSGTLRVDGTTPQIIVSTQAAQTIAAGNTVTADACGGLKILTSAGAVTTDTTNTFTAPSPALQGCCMDVKVIAGAGGAITLDANANFESSGAADVVLGAKDTVRVCCDGVVWSQIGATGNN